MIKVTRNQPLPPEPTFGIEGLSQRQMQLIVGALHYWETDIRCDDDDADHLKELRRQLIKGGHL